MGYRGLIQLDAITLKPRRISCTTGAAALLSSFTITVIVEIHISSCLAAFFSPGYAPILIPSQVACYHPFLHYNICSCAGALYFSVLNIYPVYSAHHPLGAQIALVVATNPIPFGGHKQVQTTSRELALVGNQLVSSDRPSCQNSATHK